VGNAGGAVSSLGLSPGFPIPLCMSASSITSIELSADDRDDAIGASIESMCKPNARDEL
jgi:hypothetical protein